MSYLSIIEGDLLENIEKNRLVCHQCNCVSVNAKTLAEIIFKKYDYANTYKYRMNGDKNTWSIPGTIDVCNIVDNPVIINMYAQYYPGKNYRKFDSKKMREKWFSECLDKIKALDGIHDKIVSFPYLIGCAAGGGDWSVYLKMISDFAENNKIKVVLYKLSH